MSGQGVGKFEQSLLSGHHGAPACLHTWGTTITQSYECILLRGTFFVFVFFSSKPLLEAHSDPSSRQRRPSRCCPCGFSALGCEPMSSPLRSVVMMMVTCIMMNVVAFYPHFSRVVHMSVVLLYAHFLKGCVYVSVCYVYPQFRTVLHKLEARRWANPQMYPLKLYEGPMIHHRPWLWLWWRWWSLLYLWFWQTFGTTGHTESSTNMPLMG